MKRARRLAQLLGGGGLLDAKQLSGLNYFFGGEGGRGFVGEFQCHSAIWLGGEVSLTGAGFQADSWWPS